MLCKAGDHRVAFTARALEAIELWPTAEPGPCYARAAFDLPPAPGRILKGELYAVVVDSLEILTERAVVLPRPPLLEHVTGGAVQGFVVTGDALWPLLELGGFAEHLAGAAPQEALL